MVPAVWDRARRAVDDGAGGGRYLLTGSADVPPGIRIHSGAGRIVSMQMSPLSFYERGLQEPSFSLAELLDGTRQRVSGSTEIDIASYVEEILRSGFPGIRDVPEKLRTRQLNSYISRLAERDLPTNGVSVKDPVALRKWLAAYAAATAPDASYTTILDAATPGEGEKPHRSTDHEVDLIVENPDHSVVAIEVELAPTTSEKDVKHLHRLEQQLGP